MRDFVITIISDAEAHAIGARGRWFITFPDGSCEPPTDPEYVAALNTLADTRDALLEKLVLARKAMRDLSSEIDKLTGQ